MTEELSPGAPAPPFTLSSTDGDVSLDALVGDGHRAVIAFYFEDGTPSCQSEVAMLKDAHELLSDYRARVVAISADDIESHVAFAERLGGVPFPLASDRDLKAARAYGVVDEADGRRSRRAVFVVGGDRNVMLAIPRFQPSNLSQVQAIFDALGAEA